MLSNCVLPDVARRLALGLGLAWAVGLCACGESADQSSRLNHTLGGVKEGVPLGRAVADPAILQDATTYQPAKVPAGAGEPAAAKSAGKRSPGGEAETQIKAAVDSFVAALQEGRADRVLELFDPTQIEPLLDKSDVLFKSFEKMKALQQAVAAKLDEAAAAQLASGLLPGAGAELKIDVLEDGQHASVTPNLGMVLFGPLDPTPNMRVALVDGKWLFQPGAPLDDAKVAGIVAYHGMLQKGLDAAIEYVESHETIEPAELQRVLMQSLTGEAPSEDSAKAEPENAPNAADEGEKPPKEKEKPGEDEPETGGDKPKLPPRPRVPPPGL
jgi:hypothetical protein